MMKKYYHLVRKESMAEIADFVRANLHYLSKEEQGLFYTIDKFYRPRHIENKKSYYG